MNRIPKKLAIALFVLPMFAAALLATSPVPTRAGADDFDAAAMYKTKCAMCHTATAGKYFDAAKGDDVLKDAILKGVKGDKPPAMPAYADKGVTDEQAARLVAFMRSLKQ